MEPTPLRKKVLLLPNFITAFGLACGLFAIFRMALTPISEVDAPFLTEIAGILLIAALCDILDGAVARAMKAESEFGGLFDSLADSISFGVAPAVIALKSIPFISEGKENFFLMAAAMIFSLCGVLRLVRFNVQAQRDKGDEELLLVAKKFFTGLPIPGGAACALSLTLLLALPEVQKILGLSAEGRGWLLGSALVLLGYVMISRWKFPSVKTLRVPVGSFERVFLLALVAVCILFGLVFYFPFIFFAVSWGYFLMSWGVSLFRRFTSTKEEQIADDSDEEDPFV